MARENLCDDVECRELAEKIKAKYPMFAHVDLDKMKFIRSDKKSSKVSETIPVKSPFDTHVPYVYAIKTYTKPWLTLSDPQRQLMVFERLCSISMNGFDPNSKEYAKIRPKNVKEYSEVLAAAGGLVGWYALGMVTPPIL